MENLRKTGLAVTGDVPWGTHFCQFYQTRNDLVDILVPYFKAGLENNEFCLWVTSEPLDKDSAINALRDSCPYLDERIEQGQIEFLSYNEWYKLDGIFDADRVLAGWLEKLDSAVKKGYAGLRLTGNTFFLETEDWTSFTAYEERINNIVSDSNILAICTYSFERCGCSEIIDVLSNHKFTLVRKESKWSIIENSTQKNLEKALSCERARHKESEEKYYSLFTRMLDGFALHRAIFDKDNKPIDYIFLEVNSAFEKLTGLRCEDIVGRRVTEAMPGIENEPSDWIGIYGKVADTGEEIKFENYAESLDRWYSVSAYCPQKGYFATIFHDITARKKNEQELDRIVEQKTRELDGAREELRQAKRLSDIGTLAATVAHELRNPLAVIKTALYNIKRKHKNKAIDTHILSIEEKIAESAMIINNLLNYASIKKPAYEKVNVKELIEAAIDTVRERFEERDLRISLDARIKRDFAIDADSFQIKEVLINIMNNACQAVEDRNGRVAVFAGMEDSHLAIKVADNGAGIDKSELENIFKPFYTTKSKGTGLGLTICNEMVSLHKGIIEVESEKGKGTAVTAKLPVRRGIAL